MGYSSPFGSIRKKFDCSLCRSFAAHSRFVFHSNFQVRICKNCDYILHRLGYNSDEEIVHIVIRTCQIYEIETFVRGRTK